MKDGRLDGGEAEEAVVEHLLEDLEVAQEGGRGMGVAVDADQVGVRLEQGEAVGQGGVGRVVRAVLGWSGRCNRMPNETRQGDGTRRRGRRRRGWGSRDGRVVMLEDLAEEGLHHGDLDECRGGHAAAGDDGREPVGPGFLAAGDRLDQPGGLTKAEPGPGPKRPAAVKS